jgi:hypothetical protein
LAKDFRVGTLARGQRSALGAAIEHAQDVSGVAPYWCTEHGSMGFPLLKFHWSTVVPGVAPDMSSVAKMTKTQEFKVEKYSSLKLPEVSG